jgi:hypothetical protein
MQDKLEQLSRQFPIVTLTGPRQSGKSTLARMAFPDYRYVSFEDPDMRRYAGGDPRAFLSTYDSRVILDKVQRVPEILNYLQTHVDATGEPGQYILTGSENFLLMGSVTQSLAGRTGLLTLYPFSQSELQNAGLLPGNLNEWLFKGAYPRIYDRDIYPTDYYPAYVQTYLERDVRLLSNVGDIEDFRRFMRLCAGRIGNILDMGELSDEAGIDRRTCKRWLGILEASNIIVLVQPYFKNFNKRLVKRPKLYFTDTGLAASLLGMRSHADVELSPFRGALFENLVLLERLKAERNQGFVPDVWFWHETATNEVDFIFGPESRLTAVEAKSGATFNERWTKSMKVFTKLAELTPDRKVIVYGGDVSMAMSEVRLVSWRDW